MSWIRYSKAFTLGVLLALSVVAAGTAAGLSVTTENAAAEYRVGQPVSVNVTIEDPFTGDAANQWTLNGRTEATEVVWSVRVLDQGQVVRPEETFGSASFNYTLSRDGGGDTVVIQLQGTAPAIENYTYAPEERFTVADMNRISGSNTADLETIEAHHYTNESKEARDAIESAEQAYDEDGGPDSVQNRINDSIAFYESEQFGQAVDNANEARTQVSQAEQSQQTTTLILYAVGAIVLLALIGGGIYYWRSQQESYSKL
jgi:VIT1/CCC1 family predicted Fe2+/Mn2+ transporter